MGTETIERKKPLNQEYVDAVNKLWDYLEKRGILSDELETYLYAKSGRLLSSYELRAYLYQLKEGTLSPDRKPSAI